MAKKSMIQRDIKRKKLINKHIKKRTIIKNKIKQAHNFEEQLTVQKALQKIPRNSSPTRLRNRCWLSGRSRGYYRIFGLSRHVIREMGHECLIPGLQKSSW
uniref:Small ribosomal subunit protein uS14c n=1 Tax=Calliarthron tuberculosum TaxID=48942 RepID=M4ITP9_CALTB|nr:30S ribosomal protein S14 [Calliarthron tuberculosum]AGA63845.1 30S ribosomal protein S14 [Calliarthron tuberculosum]